MSVGHSRFMCAEKNRASETMADNAQGARPTSRAYLLVNHACRLMSIEGLQNTQDSAHASHSTILVSTIQISTIPVNIAMGAEFYARVVVLGNSSFRPIPVLIEYQNGSSAIGA